MTSTAAADPGPSGIWPAGTVSIPEGVVRHGLRDTDVMDPYLPEELFNPATGAWIGRGSYPGPAPELWAQIWGMEWPPPETAAFEPSAEWLLDRFNFEATCFGLGFAMGSPWGHVASFYCGIVAVLWARLNQDRYGTI